MASCPSSGTHTAVRSPARSSLASATASSRLVVTRSPGFTGISEGATTMQEWPRSLISRAKERNAIAVADGERGGEVPASACAWAQDASRAGACCQPESTSLRYRHINADKDFCEIDHGSSSCGEDRLGRSEQPSKTQCRASHLRPADIRSYS
jgi:hypothetical protein